MLGAIMQASEISLMEKKSPTQRVLVVDDEPLIRWSLAETLGDSGYQVVESSDGRGATGALQAATREFDVILLDYRLPDSEGLSLLAAIRQIAPHTQVILMTAYGSPEVIRGALGLGAFRVVTKPLEMQDVTTLVAEASAATRSH
jgi:DNA-binding NtrC family response regulator